MTDRRKEQVEAVVRSLRKPYLWEQEFPAGYAVPDVISECLDLIDVSWHNDVSPSFQLDYLGLAGDDAAALTDAHLNVDHERDIRLWVAAAQRAQREDEDDPLLMVTDSHGTSGGPMIFQSDDIADFPKALAAMKAAY